MNQKTKNKLFKAISDCRGDLDLLGEVAADQEDDRDQILEDLFYKTMDTLRTADARWAKRYHQLSNKLEARINAIEDLIRLELGK